MTKNEMNAKLENARVILRDAHLSGDLGKLKTAKEAATVALTEVNDEIIVRDYEKFLKDKKPMRAAIIAEFHKLYTFKEIKAKGTDTVVDIKLDNILRLVDIGDFEDYKADGMLCENHQWVNYMKKFTYIVGCRATTEIGGSLDNFKKIAKLEKAARACDIGATPTSNTQMAKQLQKIVDCIIFEGNGKGQNKLKVLNADAARLVLCACRDSKNSNNVVMPKVKTITGLVTKCINRILTNGTYEAE